MTRKQALIVFGAATVAFTVILELVDPSRQVAGTPSILDFEFATSHARAEQIISEWGPKGRDAAHLSLILDYGYMLSYGVFFALVGFAIRDTARGQDLRRAQRDALETWRWVDRDAGIGAIPIDVAIDIVVRDGGE